MTQSIRVRSPANIAIVKYMGKENAELNLPKNPSLSLTLNSLCTIVEVKWVEKNSYGEQVQWIPDLPHSAPPLSTVPKLSAKGIDRFQQHAERVLQQVLEILPKQGFEIFEKAQLNDATLEIRSANSFPQAAGIASSASSFSALTLAVLLSVLKPESLDIFEKTWSENHTLKRLIAQLSRMGSGSSCRSFEGPWVLWEKETAQAIASQIPPLVDLILILSEEEKAVSSSEAHERIRTSPLWGGRPTRATERVRLLREALVRGDLGTISEIAWLELWEMHSLFHTASNPFTYLIGDSLEALRFASLFLKEAKPPLVTLDAGANVHWIVPAESKDVWLARLQERFPSNKILIDTEGSGIQFKI